MQPDRDEVGGRYSKYVLLVLIIVYVFNFIDRQILSILAEEIKADLGISDADIGFLYGTAFAVFYAVFGIPLGRMADVWVRKNLISLGLGFWSLMTALSGTARSFVSLAGYRFGVGVGEASATPAAFSMLSDLFPPRMRATVLAIYSSGIYIGAGIGLFLGGSIVDGWNSAFPDPADAPFGLKGWQAAFFAVGLPGLAMALWVWTLREPRRGQSEGIFTPEHPHPFRESGRALAAVVPPFTAAALYLEGGTRALVINLAAALAIGAAAYAANVATQTPNQWIALGVGVYAAVSWVHNLKLSDPATFGMMFGSRAFVLTTIGFPAISFVTYGVGFWSPPLMLRVHGVSPTEVGTVLGLGAALGGWLGITLGGWLADHLRRYMRAASPSACSRRCGSVPPPAPSTRPYLIGQVSDVYIRQGWEQGDALRQAMLGGLGMLLVSMGFLMWACAARKTAVSIAPAASASRSRCARAGAAAPGPAPRA